MGSKEEEKKTTLTALLQKSWQFLLKVYDEELTFYASSLSFHTIFAIIPLLLIALSIFTSLPDFQGYYAKIKEFLFSALLPTHQEIISEYIDEFLKNAVKMGIMSFVFVIFATMMFFSNYEYITGKIFGTRPRTFVESLTTYWTLITLGPIALALSFYLSNLVNELLQSSSYTDWINFLSIFPYLVVWILFFVTYLISAGIKVRTDAALISSFVASLVWYGGKNLFTYYVLYNKTYLSIYGSFSTILFFFLWIYLSWIIFLYGLKLCYVIHTIGKEEQEEQQE